MSLSPIILNLRRDIALSLEAIEAFQLACSHPSDNVTKVPRSNADDYDRPGVGLRYWFDCHCGHCDKHWQQGQSI